MATIKDVARAANVSTATVSAVINDSAYVSAELRGARARRDQGTQLCAVARRAEPQARPQPADRAGGRRSRQPVLLARGVGGGGGGRGLGLFAAGVQQRREAGGRAAHPQPHPHAVLRRRRAGAGRRFRRSICSAIPTASRSRPCCSAARSRTTSRTRSPSTTSRPAGRRRNICSTSATRGIGTITGPLHLTTGRGRLDGHAGGDEGARAGARAAARPLRRVPRGCGLFGGAQPAGAAGPADRRSTWRAA